MNDLRGRRVRLLGFAALIVAGLAATAYGTGRLGYPAAEASLTAPENGVLRATLPNGLRVVLVRNALAPVVATSVNYLVGSNDTPDGFPGTAHAMEHMMFRGSPGMSADQLANIGSVMGGNFNANTRENLTQYLFTVPAEDLDVALNIEAVRMQAILSDEKDWAQERGAISQEVASNMSSPNYLLFAKLREIMFKGTPYEHDALGTRPSFEKTTAADLKAFHETWYAPNNAVLVVVGDLDLQKTLAKVTQLFGGIARKDIPAHPEINLQTVMPSEPLSIPTDSASSALVLAMRMPGLDHPDFPALEVLSDVLNSARGDFYALVPAGKALATSFSMSPLQKVSLAYAALSFPADQDAKAAEAELRAVLGKIVREGVPAELVAAAKIQEQRQAEFQKNSISGLASIWSEAVAVCGLTSPDEDLQRIEKVTVEDVNRVARQYLDLDNAVVAVMVPRETGAPVESAGFGGQESIQLGEAEPTKLPDWAESALNRLSVPRSSVKPIVSTLSNGLTLIVQPADVSDSVTVYGHIKSRPEVNVPAGKEGLSDILDQLFEYGSESLDRIALQEALDEIGAEESAGTDFSVRTLTRDLDRGLQLLADNQLRPALPDDAFNIIKDQTARVVTAQLKSPGYLMQRALRESLFPATDPSLRDATPESVRAITLVDIKDYYKKTFRPDLTTIVMVGKIAPEQAKLSIEKYFGAWKAEGPKPPIDLPVAVANKPSTVAVPDESRVQNSVILAQTVPLNRSNPDYYAINLGTAVLGGSFYSTRLSIDLRKNAGLVYSVGADINAGRTRGNYFIQYASDPENVSKAQAIVVRELKQLQDVPVGDEELRRVKALMLRQIPLGESSIGRIASGLAGRWDLDLPLDEPTRAAERYVAMTPGEIQAAFKKWIRPDDLVRITQGPPPQ
ncbi:MAG: insulinase family protein [Alphaproteobacteria bacterium]|nr:insulinase family protein [Alphaproteobacteria bacterium]